MLLPALLCLLLQLLRVFATEFTFELADKDKQCFYEELEKDEKFDIHFQVSSVLPVNTDDCSLCDSASLYFVLEVLHGVSLSLLFISHHEFSFNGFTVALHTHTAVYFQIR